VSFHEVQHVGEWGFWAIALGAAIVGFAVAAAILWAARKTTAGPIRWLLFCGAAMAAVPGLLVPLFGAMLAMTTDVGETAIHVAITPWLYDGTVELSQIEQVQVRRYDPIGEFGGWGIRYGRGGRALNMTGDRGVQLRLRGGELLLIGSQRPEEFAAAIEARRTPTNWTP
jgi:hypothetical protein